jgi:uncharacterized membrane protein required for colicin V production
MVIIDILVILIIILFGIYGYKTGFIKTVVDTIGLILVFVFAFLFKDPIAEWLSFNLPFFGFGGAFKGVTILNVIIYQLIAFIVVFSVLLIIYGLLIKITSLIEKILKWSFVLKLPSKVLGFFVGLIQGIVVSSIILMVASLPIFNFDVVHGSVIKDFILESVPITGTLSSGLNKSINEIVELKEIYVNNDNSDEFNGKCLDILLKYNIINVDYAERLIASKKLTISNSEEILDKYR